jgi:hypothetical protein
MGKVTWVVVCIPKCILRIASYAGAAKIATALCRVLYLMFVAIITAVLSSGQLPICVSLHQSGFWRWVTVGRIARQIRSPNQSMAPDDAVESAPPSIE